ncbi:MAG: hypothetical protein GY750_14140 [Lentisphaerae bacterium]|nr:hypothetical protein [Lentisphaerota bacterium]
MADGSTKPIGDIEVGDLVESADPVAGVRRGEEVLAVFVHDDTTIDFATSAGVVTTTEDHHFWNATDIEWQESQLVDAGDLLLAGGGGQVAAVGLDWATSQYQSVYNLDVDSLDSYFVVVGDNSVLVHNDDELLRTPSTHPDEFESVRGSRAVRNNATGEIWELDMLHRDHFEVYKNKKQWENGNRIRDVWADGRLKGCF